MISHHFLQVFYSVRGNDPMLAGVNKLISALCRIPLDYFTSLQSSFFHPLTWLLPIARRYRIILPGSSLAFSPSVGLIAAARLIVPHGFSTYDC